MYGQNDWGIAPQENPMPQSKMFSTVALLFAMMTASALAQRVPVRQLLRRNPASAQSQPVTLPATGIGSNPFLPIDYPGGIANQNPFAINDNGKIVGLVIFADGSIKGYQLQGKTFKDIVYPGGLGTVAYGINRSGLIVGAYCSDVNCDTIHGFSLKGKTYTSLDFPGGMNTNPSSVNAAGDIAGYYQTPDLVAHGFLLHKGVYTSFDVPGASLTYAFGINNQGIIVGGYGNPDGSGGGFILQNGVFTRVDYPGASGTEVIGINDSDDMVGIYTDAGDNHNHGFLLSGGVFTGFDVPFPGSISTIPNNLNNHHQIVGSYGSYPPEADTDYFFGFLTTY